MPNTRTPNKEVRHLVLIDVENLAANPRPSQGEVLAVKAALEAQLPEHDSAFWVVACTHHAAPAVMFEFPRARQLWRSGPDGADLALRDVMAGESIEGRFGLVTICSGDGIFADEAARLARHGVSVTAVAGRGGLSAKLRLAAREVHRLNIDDGLAATGSVG